jgi:hypothetical protein
MKLVIALALIALVGAQNLRPDLAQEQKFINAKFEDFKKKHGRNYATPEEESYRRQIYHLNLHKAASMNN